MGGICGKANHNQSIAPRGPRVFLGSSNQSLSVPKGVVSSGFGALSGGEDSASTFDPNSGADVGLTKRNKANHKDIKGPSMVSQHQPAAVPPCPLNLSVPQSHLPCGRQGSVPVKPKKEPGINTTLEQRVAESNPGTSTLIKDVNDTPTTAAEKAEAGQVSQIAAEK